MTKATRSARSHEAGSGHLLLAGLIVLVIVGALGVVGYNAFKRSQMASTKGVSSEEALIKAKVELDRADVEVLTDSEKAAREDAGTEPVQSTGSSSSSGSVNAGNTNARSGQGSNAGSQPSVDKKMAFQAGKPETFTYSIEGLCQLDGYLYIRDEAKKNDTSVLEISFDDISPFTYKLEYHLDREDGFATESQNYLGSPQFSNKSIKPGVNYFRTGIAGKNLRFSALRNGTNKWSTILNNKPITDITQCANIAFTAGTLSVCQYQDVIYVKRNQKPYDIGSSSTAKLGFRFDRTMTTVNNLYERGPGVFYFSSKIRGKQLDIIRTDNDIYAQNFAPQDIEYSKSVNEISACNFL